MNYTPVSCCQSSDHSTPLLPRYLASAHYSWITWGPASCLIRSWVTKAPARTWHKIGAQRCPWSPAQKLKVRKTGRRYLAWLLLEPVAEWKFSLCLNTSYREELSLSHNGPFPCWTKMFGLKHKHSAFPVNKGRPRYMLHGTLRHFPRVGGAMILSSLWVGTKSVVHQRCSPSMYRAVSEKSISDHTVQHPS